MEFSDSAMDALIAKFSQSEIVTLQQIASRWNDDAHPLWRLSLFLDASEFFTKMHAAHAFELFRQSGLHEKHRGVYDEIRKELSLPTMGSWRNSFSKAADALADALKEDRNSKRADHRSVSPRRTVENVEAFNRIAPSIRKALAGLVTLRNERAHGATPPKEEVQRLVNDHLCELGALADPFLTEKSEDRFALEYSPPASDPLRSPAWAKVVLVHANGRVELFPWCVARIERDVPSAIHIFNRIDRKSGTWRFDYLDHGLGSEHSLAVDQDAELHEFVAEKLRVRIQTPAGPLTFSSRIDELTRGFAGRDSELKRAQRFVDSNTPGILLVIGDPGMGKSALAATIVDRLKLIHHFCQRDDERTVKADDVISNLRGQAVRRLPADLSGATIADALNGFVKHSSNSTALIDGLDEMEHAELQKLLRKIGELEQQCPAMRFILLGQPQVESEIRRGVDSYVIRLGGLKEPDIAKIADYLELWNFGWRRRDSIKLARRTDGMPLFVVQVMTDVANGSRDRAELDRIPKTVKEYWAEMISRALNRLSRSSGLDVDKVRKISSDALKAISQNPGRHQLVPDYPTLARAMKEEIERSTQIENLLIIPSLLAASPIPLSRTALSEISGIEIDEIADYLNEFRGFVTEIEVGAESTFRLHHNLAAAFLREEYAGVLQGADNQLFRWASNWRDGEARRAAYPFILSRQWRANPGCDQIEKATATLLRSWDFLLPRLQDSGVRSLIAFCEEFTSREKRTTDRVRESLGAEARIKSSTKHGGYRVLAEMERRRREERDQFEKRQREEHDADEAGTAIDDTNDSSDADGAADLSAMLANYTEEEEREKQRLAEPLPVDYFADWGNMKATLAEIRTGYAAALEENLVWSDCSPAIRRIRQIESFLRANELALTRTLDEPDPMPGIAEIMARSHLLGGTALKRKANDIVAGNPSPRLHIHPSPERTGSSECSFVHLNRQFCVAVGEPILVYVLDDPGYSKNPIPGRQTRLAIHNWIEEKAPKSVLVDGRAAVVAVSSDGSRVLLQIERPRKGEMGHSFLIFNVDRDESLEVVGTKDVTFLAATPDLRFGLFASHGRLHVASDDPGKLIFVDLAEDKVVARFTVSDGCHYVRKGKVTADGAFAVVLFDGPRSYFLWNPRKNVLRPIRDVSEGLPGCREPDRFSVSPNGRFLFSGRNLLDIGEEKVVRKFRDVDGEGPSAFSNDGRILVAGNATGEIVVFDVEQGRLIGSVRCRQPAEELVLSPDGRFALIKTRLEHFAAIDLTASSLPARRGRLGLDNNLEMIPVAPERQEMAFREHDGDCFQIVDLRTGALREVLDQSTGGKFLSPEGRFLGGYVTRDRIWVLRQPFTLLELSKRSGKMISETCLMQDGLPEDIGRRDHGTLPLSESEIAVAFYPNILATIDLNERRLRLWPREKLREIELDTLTGNRDALFGITIHGEVIAWDLPRDVVSMGGRLGSSAWAVEVVHVRALSALAVFERAGRFFGLVRLPELEFVSAEKEQRDCSIQGKVLLVDEGPLLFCGIPQLYADRDDSLIGVCLFDPTPGKELYFGRITFEVPAHSISRLGRRQFGILFSDGSTGVVRVNP